MATRYPPQHVNQLGSQWPQIGRGLTAAASLAFTAGASVRTSHQVFHRSRCSGIRVKHGTTVGGNIEFGLFSKDGRTRLRVVTAVTQTTVSVYTAYLWSAGSGGAAILEPGVVHVVTRLASASHLWGWASANFMGPAAQVVEALPTTIMPPADDSQNASVTCIPAITLI